MTNKKILKKFGFKTDQEGIINRYLRESESWDKHLNKTKNYILNAAQNKAKRTAIVLGSGWLLDVPFEELAKLFKRLVLVDIVHPSQITHKVKRIENIELIETDITGLSEQIYNSFKDYKKNKNKCNLVEVTPTWDAFFLEEIDNADYIVSVNLLNQLDILICDYIKKQDIHTKQEINDLRKKIQSSHLKLLIKEKSVLITDYKELNFDDEDKKVNEKQLVFIELPNSTSSARWEWEFDTKKTYHKNLKTTFKVMATEL